MWERRVKNLIRPLGTFSTCVEKGWHGEFPSFKKSGAAQASFLHESGEGAQRADEVSLNILLDIVLSTFHMSSRWFWNGGDQCRELIETARTMCSACNIWEKRPDVPGALG
jgi:hypothetical protein